MPLSGSTTWTNCLLVTYLVIGKEIFNTKQLDKYTDLFGKRGDVLQRADHVSYVEYGSKSQHVSYLQANVFQYSKCARKLYFSN